MNLKKDSNKIKKVSFLTFKRFLRNKRWLFVFKKNQISAQAKTMLIFALLFLFLQTNKKFKKITTFEFKQFYKKFHKFDGALYSCDHLIAFLNLICENKEINNEYFKEELNITEFYENLCSFFSKSYLLKYSNHKKLKKFQIEESDVQNFIILNQNMKFILNFIKLSNPISFNLIYLKLMYLS